MKQRNRIRGLLLLTFVTALMMAMSVHAEEAVKQPPVYLTIDGLTGSEVHYGDVLTFRAVGGSAEEYWLEINVDGSKATFSLGRGNKGVRTFRVGGMNNDGTILPPGWNYTVRAFTARTLASPLRYEPEYSQPQSFTVKYDSPSYYKLVATPAVRYYDPHYSQYALDSAPTLYYYNGKDWIAWMDPEELGAVFRYEIRDESGKLVSQDGMIKERGAYTVDVVEIFDDPFTGRTVSIPAQRVITRMGAISVDPGMLDGGKGTVGQKVDCELLDGGKGAVGAATMLSAAAKPGEAVVSASAIKVKKVSITSLKAKKGKKAVLKFKAVKGAGGYEIVYGTSKNLKKGSKTINTTKTSVTLKGLKKNTCYVKVRAYRINEAGEKVYGAYSAVKKVKIKK